MKTDFQTAADVFGGWQDDVLKGVPPTLYAIGDGPLRKIEVGPGLVTLVGGAPAAGKTAFVMQATLNALQLTPSLRALVCNVEMSPLSLLDRQLARLSGVDLTTVRYRTFTPEQKERIATAFSTIEAVTERLVFASPPFSLDTIIATVNNFKADLIVLDYIQRIQPPGEHADRRGAVDATMHCLRRLADDGRAVVAVSALARTKDARGRSTYCGDGLGLASFRESSELEFGADDAFILMPDSTSNLVTLSHLKARYAEPADITLCFDRAHQSFAIPEASGQDAWQPTPALAVSEDQMAATQNSRKGEQG